MHVSVEGFENAWICCFFPLPVVLFLCCFLPSLFSSFSPDDFSHHFLKCSSKGSPERIHWCRNWSLHCKAVGGSTNCSQTQASELSHLCQQHLLSCLQGSNRSIERVGIFRTVAKRICAVVVRGFCILTLIVLSWNISGMVPTCSQTECFTP